MAILSKNPTSLLYVGPSARLRLRKLKPTVGFIDREALIFCMHQDLSNSNVSGLVFEVVQDHICQVLIWVIYRRAFICGVLSFIQVLSMVHFMMDLLTFSSDKVQGQLWETFTGLYLLLYSWYSL